MSLNRVAQRSREGGAVQMLLGQKILRALPQRLDGQKFVFGLRQNDHGRVRRRGTRGLHTGAALPLPRTQIEQQDIRWIAGKTLDGKIEVRDVRNMESIGISCV